MNQPPGPADSPRASIEETLAQLGVDPGHGLSAADAEERLAKFGYNEIQVREESLAHRLFRRFWGPIPWMIETAAILSAVVGKWDDFAIIVVMLLVNASLDFLQEHRALNALKALRSELTPIVTVRRDGRFATLPIRELVPGDILKVRIGDVVPCDIQLVEGEYLSVDQSALTGESLAVDKQAGDLAFSNTVVKQGEMLGVVMATGSATRFHSVVALVAQAERQQRSHFQKMVMQIGNFLILVTIVLIFLIVMVALFRHENMLEIARFAMVLAVAAIPVALPAVLSVTMAVGALNLARHRAVVSRLTAIEELAGVDVFCSDKTGTLTKNEMEVSEPVVFSGHDERELFWTATLCSREENRDPIETAIFRYSESRFPDSDSQSPRQIRFMPFDPIRKRTEAEVETDSGDRFTAIKGAPQVLLDLAQLPDESARNVNAIVDGLAAKGYRTLAVGRQQGDAAMDLVGLIPLYDPPRDDSRTVIRDMRDCGIQVKMITGDNMAIAREIGRILGLETRAVRSSQLRGSGSQELLDLAAALALALYRHLKPGVTQTEARRFANDVIATVRDVYDTSLLEREFIHTHESAIVGMIESVELFAEVVPEDKYLIVDTLQKGGHIVGMTGDGVNDAPALKKADCGIAVSGATDAARAAADIVLTASGLGVINEAVKQARITFERMKSYSIYRIAETIRVILFMTLSIVIFDFYPITALMIIALALLNDIPILSIAYDNTRVSPSPVRWRMTELLTVASVLGLAGVAASFLLFFIATEMGLPEPVIQSLIFAKLVVAGHLTIFLTRTDGWFFQRPFPSPLLLWTNLLTAVLGTLIAVYGFFVAPVGWQYALYVWAYAVSWFLFNDAVKRGTLGLLRKWNGTVGSTNDGNQIAVVTSTTI